MDLEEGSFRWRENVGEALQRFNLNILGIHNYWAPDYHLRENRETWGVPMMRGVAHEVSETAQLKDIEGAIVDIWLVLEPVETISARGEPMETIDHDMNVFEHTGYLEQYYCQNEQKQDACLHCSTVRTPLYIDVPNHLPAS
jgi:hypothetical protein